MLKTLTVKPIQLVMVKPVAFKWFGTALATWLENCGESATTAIPQIHHPRTNK